MSGWQAASVVLDAADVERVSDALLDAGALAVDVADPQAGGDAAAPLDEAPDEPFPLWPRCRVTALFAADADLATAMAAAAAGAGLAETPLFECAPVAERDWVRVTQAQFPPQRVSERLWIIPTWHDPPDPAAVNIRLDPGLAFGTGSHPTTRLCLRWLDAVVHGGEHVIDYGCGSGILAVAALKLGAAGAIGVDIDPQAVRASRANAELNGVVADFRLADRPLRETADIVVANILANPLKVLAPVIAPLLAPGGRLALAGILAPQAAEVAAAYRGWLALDVWAEQEGWVLLAGRREG
ncbi:MAG TPA: 50S ribosomal protein L11 methyltransferase [Pelomicrobium sp.]|nr:50S ribosomal protein L11 methyltransferase [Pelomicrobium sp.]